MLSCSKRPCIPLFWDARLHARTPAQALLFHSFKNWQWLSGFHFPSNQTSPHPHPPSLFLKCAIISSKWLLWLTLITNVIAEGGMMVLGFSHLKNSESKRLNYAQYIRIFVLIFTQKNISITIKLQQHQHAMAQCHPVPSLIWKCAIIS